MSEKQFVEENTSSFFRDFLFIIKRYFFLILAVVILATAGGAGYAYTRKPEYIASSKVAFQARTSNDASITTSDINVMLGYIDTVVDFCDEGVVIDRANYYYVQWRNGKESGKYETLGEFFDANDNSELYNSKDPDHTNLPIVYFKKSNISTVTTGKDKSTQLIFSIRYKDEDRSAAQEKVRILSYALSKELGSRVSPTNPNKLLTSEYFSDIYVQIKDLGYEGVTAGVSKKKLVVLFAFVGVIAGVALAYVFNKLDNTVKSNEELESLTGTKVLASVDNNGGKRNG